MKQLKNKNTRYICLFLFLFLLIITMFYCIYVKHRNTVEQQQRNQLGVLSTTGANYVKSYLEEKQYEIGNILTITTLGDSPKEINQQVNQQIKLYWSIALTYLDYLKYYSVNDLETTEIAGLSKEELLAYKAQAMTTNEIVIGPWVNINADHNGIYIFKGIFNENGRHGLVVGRIDLKMAFKKTIGQMPVGDSGYFTLGDINNNKLLKGDSSFYRTSDSTNIPIKKDAKLISGYSYIDFGEHHILVSAKLPYYEISQPIKLTFYFLIGLSIGLLFLFVFITVTLVKMNSARIEHSMAMQYQEELAALNKNATLGIFSREIAHDYNNLLTPIQIYCELLEMELSENKDLADYVAEINHAVEQCKSLANRLLAFGRNAVPTSSNVKFDSVNVIRSSIKRLRLLAPERIEINVSLPQAPVTLYGEQLELMQLLYNLCLNSIHAMEALGGTLSIQYEVTEQYAILTIADTGNGMSEEVQKQIFSSGFTTKKNGLGNGLGLAIVSKIVDNYNGTISFKSTHGVGTTFTVKLPYC